jgi:hypothetical protein
MSELSFYQELIYLAKHSIEENMDKRKKAFPNVNANINIDGKKKKDQKKAFPIVNAKMAKHSIKENKDERKERIPNC